MIDGLATATIVASTRIMKKPTIMAHSACHGFAVGAAPPVADLAAPWSYPTSFRLPSMVSSSGLDATELACSQDSTKLRSRRCTHACDSQCRHHLLDR